MVGGTETRDAGVSWADNPAEKQTPGSGRDRTRFLRERGGKEEIRNLIFPFWTLHAHVHPYTHAHMCIYHTYTKTKKKKTNGVADMPL